MIEFHVFNLSLLVTDVARSNREAMAGCAIIFPIEIQSGITSFLYEARLRGIMGVIFIKTNIQSKVMNTTTINQCRRISKKKLAIRDSSNE